MLMAGLFSSESYAALAGTVDVKPATVTAGETVDLRITYTSTTTLAVDDPAFVKDQRGTIQIMLPANWVVNHSTNLDISLPVHRRTLRPVPCCI